MHGEKGASKQLRSNALTFNHVTHKKNKNKNINTKLWKLWNLIWSDSEVKAGLWIEEKNQVEQESKKHVGLNLDGREKT